MGTNGVSSIDAPTAARQLAAEVRPVKDLLSKMRLDIPSYQRPYTWTVKNVAQLVSDIRRFRTAGHYRIGTFILNPSAPEGPHDASSFFADPPLDIVDGQQRYLSFALIIHALASRSEEIDADLSEELRHGIEHITIPVRRDGRSEQNLRENYSHLQQLISRWSADELRLFTEFFLRECSVVVLVVRDLDSAFQMFDSQNTRGRALFPTDLLKAYHLRELSRTDPSRESMLATVRGWEAVPPEEINHVIAGVLFPIKQWSANRPLPRKGFTSDHVDLFKGIREGVAGNGRFRWAQLVLLAKATTDRFQQENTTLLRHGVVEELEFPFQITHPVIDGEMFFRMVHHYVREARRAGVQWSRDGPSSESRELRDSRLDQIFEILDIQPTSTGYRYVRELFDCLLIAYLDRFGWHEVHSAAFILAQHAYLLRVHLRRVQVSSVNLHARFGHDRVQKAEENLFAEMALAHNPEVILTRTAPRLAESAEVPATLDVLYPSVSDLSDGEESES
ncbi:DUF262 domain-containing protein [Kocuria rosea]|uniref:DUF262 domain-containing protein n=1 Tax=Kocuria rosea TaxID=1275 RepID=UPI002B2427BA|nr:DUF262 domain-containing protein [Kocuria rosea]MEB2529194.1 DUF262 domain-containing protein [Kocuria rosea]MEB2618321.1 DUF262 domain-containing protein [Kocuria rosea]